MCDTALEIVGRSASRDGSQLEEEAYTLLELLVILREVMPMLTRGTCGGVSYQALAVLL